MKTNVKTMLDKRLIAISMFAIAMLMTGTAEAADLFDNLDRIVGRMPVVKTGIIYFAFVMGLGALVWAGADMLKKSKQDTRNDVTWTAVLIKFVAAVVLIGLTTTSDTMQQTIFNTTTAAPSNISLLDVPTVSVANKYRA